MTRSSQDWNLEQLIAMFQSWPGGSQPKLDSEECQVKAVVGVVTLSHCDF